MESPVEIARSTLYICGNEIMKKLAFVTGAAGFIGRHVCKILSSQKWRVVGIGHGNLSFKEQRDWGLDSWNNQDITLNALETLAQIEGDPKLLLHCAGGSSVAFSLLYPREDFAQTVLTMADVLEFAKNRNGAVTVIYPSSAAVYGQVDCTSIAENTPLYPVSPYGYHKRMAEQLCQSYALHWKIPVAVIRLFSVYGIGLRKQLLWDACIKAQSKQFVFSGSGEEVRDWIHVSDAASLLIFAAEKASSNCPIVNGGSGEGLTVKEILCRLGQLWTPVLVPSFSGEQRPGDPKSYVADVVALNDWGYRLSANMNIALAEYIRWFKSEQAR